MDDEEILQEQHGNAAVEPPASVQLDHPVALRDVASLDQQRVPLRLAKRVAHERHRHVSPNAPVAVPHAVRADATCLRIAEDDAHRHSNHAHATSHAPTSPPQQRVARLAQRPEGVEGQAQSQVVAQQLRHAALAHVAEGRRVAQQVADGPQQEGRDGVRPVQAQQLLVDGVVAGVTGGDDGGLHLAADFCV